jgi:hypothetical protein
MITLTLLLFACGPDIPMDTAGPEPLDMRLSESDYPALEAGQSAWPGPEVVVEAGQDVMYCVFGTYTGPDVGVHTLVTYQNPLGHHLLLNGTTASQLDYPDGTVVDCTGTGSVSMADFEPIVLPTASFLGGEPQRAEIEIPEGMAVKLDEGQRWVMQAHYINTGTEAVRVRDVAVLEVIDAAAVETWAAPMIMNHDSFVVPPGEAATISFDCSFQADWQVIYLVGHMHEWGTSIHLDEVHDDTLTPVFAVDDWSMEYRDTPPIFRYAPGEYAIGRDAVMRTTCSWFNDTDAPLEFPHEMCASVGVVYPQLTPSICNNGTLD